jgi:hypothetical protein
MRGEDQASAFQAVGAEVQPHPFVHPLALICVYLRHLRTTFPFEAILCVHWLGRVLRASDGQVGSGALTRRGIVRR